MFVRMRLLHAWLLFFLFQATLVFAGVQVRDGKISADLNSEPLAPVLESIKEEMKIHLAVEHDVGSRTVTASFHDLTLGDSIRKILEGTGINFIVLSYGEGRPASLFGRLSERPGAPPRKLDGRPANNNRGVVTPVYPSQPDPAQEPQERQNLPSRRQQVSPPVSVPTGGGFNPATNQQEQDRQEQQDEGIPEEEQTEEQ